MNTTKDTFGNIIQAGNMIMRPLQGTFCFHRIEKVSKNGTIKVQRIPVTYGNPSKPFVFYSTPITLEQAEKLSIGQKEGGLYLPSWAQYVKIKSAEQWSIQK